MAEVLTKEDMSLKSNRLKHLVFYVLTISVFSFFIYLLIHAGADLENARVATHKGFAPVSLWHLFRTNLIHNLKEPLAILLVQIIVIILVARLFGMFFKKIGHPSVIGEIIAGIVLGPSVLGAFLPEMSVVLFPESSLGNLNFLSQIGLILFMFVIGMELDLGILKNKASDAVIISHASIIFPFTLGVMLAYFMYERFATPQTNFLSFALFIGISMSITAFPVLARIVQERGISKTKLGTIAITCAAADDITAWCILAAVIAIVKAGSVVSAFFTILMAVGYVLVMLKVVQPVFKQLGEKYANKEALSKPVVGMFFITLLLSAYTTEIIGIHALFGAFMAGVCMPQNMRFRNIFIEKIDDVAQVLLLPLFFVFTGLRTQIGLLNDGYMLQTCVIVILVAVSGKFLGSAFAAKAMGQNWRESLSIGALMNTRGLMELIALNIGYDLGVLSPQVFTMLVIMAVVTTIMTGPALNLIGKVWKESKETLPGSVTRLVRYNILVAFNRPEQGVTLLKLAGQFVRKTLEKSSLTMLHLSPSNEINQFNLEEFQRESFDAIEKAAENFGTPIISRFKPSLNIDNEIIATANNENFDLLIIGVGKSLFEGSFLGKVLGITNKIINPERLYDTLIRKEKLFDQSPFDETTRNVLKSVGIPVGIFIDKGFSKAENIFLPIFSISDSFLLIYARKLIHNSGCKIVVLDASGVIRHNNEIREAIRSIEGVAPNHIALYQEKMIDKSFLDEQDLMIISLKSWKSIVNTQSLWLSNSPSTLIIKP